MKKYLTILSMLSAAQFAAADSVSINGGADSNSRTNVPNTVTADTDLIMDSTSGMFYRGSAFSSSQTVKTLTAINTSSGEQVAGGVNIAGYGAQNNFIIDVNSAEAITGVSVASWKQNYLSATIRNSNADYASATVAVDFGSSFELSATNIQSQNFTIDNIKAVVTATNFKIGLSNNLESNKSVFTIGSKADVIWRGTTNLGISAAASPYYASFNIDGAFTLYNKGGNFTMGRGTTLNISETGSFSSVNNSLEIQTGSTANVAGNLKMEGGSTLNLYGTLNITNAAPTSQFNIYTLNTSGTFTQATAASNNGIRFWRTCTFSSGANWTIDESIDIEGNKVSGVDPSVTTAKVYLNSGSKMILNEVEGKVARVKLWGLSNLYIKQNEAITDQNGDAVRLVIAGGVNSGTYMPELHLYETQTFTDIVFAANLKVYLENDLAMLILNAEDSNTISGLGDTTTMSIYNFADNKVYVGENASTLNAVKYIQAYDADSNLVDLGVSGGFLVAVPEPAEWAAIFGAAALALAFCRRRK